MRDEEDFLSNIESTLIRVERHILGFRSGCVTRGIRRHHLSFLRDVSLDPSQVDPTRISEIRALVEISDCLEHKLSPRTECRGALAAQNEQMTPFVPVFTVTSSSPLPL